MKIWRPPSQSELTPMLFNTGLNHLGLEASIYKWRPADQSSITLMQYKLYLCYLALQVSKYCIKNKIYCFLYSYSNYKQRSRGYSHTQIYTSTNGGHLD